MTPASNVHEPSRAPRAILAGADPVVPDRQGFLQGVYVGSAVAEGVFAQQEGQGRWVIRALDEQALVRLGEVMGGGVHFQAMTMKGELVAVESSLEQAWKALLERRGIEQRQPAARRSRP